MSLAPARHDGVRLQTVDLVRIGPPVADGPPDRAGGRRGRLLDRLPFAGLVIVPTLLAALYSFGLAADRYRSEIAYVVRTPGGPASAELAAAMAASPIARSSDDAYVARAFMLSRDGMSILMRQDGLLAMFAGAGRDPLWWPTVLGTPRTEDLLRHYLRFVAVDYTASTGVSRLSMQAFDPADAQRLADALLDHAEHFLNELNARAQQDAIRAALADVDEARQTAYAALDAVTRFRNAEQTVDPGKASGGIVASISALSLELANGNARLAELVTTTPRSPEIPPLRTRTAALQEQIGRQRALLGGDAGSLAPRIARYERLLLDQQFAEKAFVSALSSLEAARLDATRQRVFIERVTSAGRADEPAAPSRAGTVLLVAWIGATLWWISRHLGRDTRGHGRR